VIAESDANGGDLRDAQRMWRRAADRAAPREWGDALERGDVELAAHHAVALERQLDLGLHVDARSTPGTTQSRRLGNGSQ
jgi:hypothetical protein